MSCGSAADFSQLVFSIAISPSASVLLANIYPRIIWSGMDEVCKRKFVMTHKEYSYAVSLRLA